MSGARVRSPVFAVVLATISVAASGCGGSKPVANTVATTTSSRTAVAKKRPLGGAAKLADEWAACERRHGDPNQANPTIDSHGVINITTPSRTGTGRRISGGPETPTGTCSSYLARAQRELRATHPVKDPHGPSQSMYRKYVTCIRANGVPNYPYPDSNDPSKTDFKGSGVDPNSPSVLKASDLCGKKLGLPEWWIKGWGMPGDISVKAQGVPPTPPPCFFEKKGCATKITPPGV